MSRLDNIHHASARPWSGFRLLGCACLLGVTTGPAAPSAPGWISRVPSSGHGHVDLAWEPVAGAVGYEVKRGFSPTGATTSLGSTAATTFTDATALPGQKVYYTIIAGDGAENSPPTRSIAASPGLVLDNGASGTTSTGVWQVSSVVGTFGSASVFAAPVAGGIPTATFTFTPDLPARGDYDVYLRWTAHANRATNTPIDFIYPDGRDTFRVNQQLNHATWVFVGSVTVEAGTATSVVIGNHDADGNVVADAIQFVPRHHPRGPESDHLSDYTLVPIDEDFDGSAIDPAVWRTFLDRGEYVVADGRLRTRLRYRGNVPLANASTADLENEANWAEGGIIARHAQKFGFHQARLRVPQLPARGVDTAYWHSATDELLNGYEIDAPEFFNKDSSGVANNFGFGVWDHIDGERTWDYTRNHSTIGDPARYVTIGLDWRTDNSQVVYINGQKVHTVPAAGMNDTESILPANSILSTKVLKWLRPNAALDGAEALWDYTRYYQKPGFLGAIDSDWSKPENWGPDGLPGPGHAAVFNLSDAPAVVALAIDQTLQSMYLDHASLPAHVFTGPGRLRLGAGKPGDPSATHGGVLVNSTVATPQTIDSSIVGLSHLQFANLSRTPGTMLFLNGRISGDGLAPRDVDFVSPLATNPNLGAINLGQPLGGGLRHINRAGDSVFHLPAGNLHTGELRVARGPVSINAISALGVTPGSAVVFRPRYKHSESWRPRLTYTGSGEISMHALRLGGWQADGVLESNGTGPLVWTGHVEIAPFAEIPHQVLTRDISLTLGATSSSRENVFAGDISDAGVTVTYLNGDGSPNTGSATLRIAKTGSGTWTLAGNNAYGGTTTISGGTLSVSSLNSVNGGNPPVPASSLGAPKSTANGTIAIASGILKYTGSGETTDRVIHLAGSSGATLDHSGTGLLEFTSDFVSSASTKTLTLTGSGQGEITGGVPDNSPTHQTHIIKSGPGTWSLSGSNTFTGNTTISAGTLIVDGSIAGGGTLSVSSGTGRLSGSGTIARPATINGTLVASPLEFSQTLAFGGSSKLMARFDSNNAAGIAAIDSSTVTINNGAKVDVVLNAPGSTTNFLQSWWRGSRSIPILTAAAKSGNFSIGTVTADSAGNNAATFGNFTLHQTATAVSLLWTPLPGFPDIDTPTVAIASPSAHPIAIADAQTSLHLSATIGGNASAAWTLTSGPGTAIFGNPASAETTVRFSGAGTYLLRVTATNALGTAHADLTIHVAPPATLGFRQGENNYSHQATFIRGDTPAWNSGSRDQILIGRNGAGMRGLLEFDLSSVPAGATVENATLALNINFTGTGTLLNTLRLHQLLTPFIEGTGDGNTAANGSGTGADWLNRAPTTPWSAPGADSGSDHALVPIASLPGFNPSTTPGGTEFTLTDPALALSAESAMAASIPLRLLLKMDDDDSGANVFARFCSDDHPTVTRRPRLTLHLAYASAPALDPGEDPSPVAGIATHLNGSIANATSTTWTQVDGPGSVAFHDPSVPSTSAVFPAPGSYTLELTASNENGQTSRTLPVSVLTRAQAWRQFHFGTTDNSGDAANDADPDHDGLANLLEFATGNFPASPDGSITTLTKNGSVLEFTYRRSHDAVADGVEFLVEWSTALSGDWSTNGVIQSAVPDTDNGLSTLWKAILPAGTNQRFVRLKTSISSP